MDMNITFGTCSVPYGPSAATRTLDKAGSAALAAYYRGIRGLPFPCCRNGKLLVTRQECLRRYNATPSPCDSREHGRCSKGAILNEKEGWKE